MGVAELIQQKSFLGKEFLTWLWYCAETRGEVKPGRGDAVTVEFLGLVVLDAQYGETRKITLRGETPATSPEARATLLEGKKATRAKLRLARGDQEWTLTLDAETFHLTGLSLPAEKDLPFEDLLGLRMAVLSEAERTLAELFESFLALRFDARDWPRELERIHQWVRGEQD